MTNKNPHENHRNRVKIRFINNDFSLEGFAPHQILEFLLFYSIPRIDTNEHGHRLIDRFGSVKGILDAKHEDLISVDGVGENTAVFLKLIAAVSKYYASSELKIGEQYDTIDKVGKFLVNLFMGTTNEKAYVLTFNGKNEMTNCKLICEGSVNSNPALVKNIVSTAIKEDAVGIVIAHNHPTGLAVPSGADIEFTSQLRYCCNQIDINLVEHIVVAGNSFAPIIKKNLADTGEIYFKKF